MVDNPITRKEKYLAKLTGSYTGNVPDPITRVEKYLYDLCQKGISGLTPEEIENAVNKYLKENPVQPGATEEQAQQIKKNTDDIASLKEDLSNKITKFYASSQGENHLADSDNGKIMDMMIYGKSSQDGTPTPENPVEIKSVVNPTVKVSNEDGTQFKTVTLPYTLNAIPVSSGGNVTIDGQQYIADYVDVERGKRVQRIIKYKITGDENIYEHASGWIYCDTDLKLVSQICATNIAKTITDQYILSGNYIRSGATGFYFTHNDIFTDVNAFKNYVKNNDVYVYTALSTPEEIDLTTEEIAAFKALATYYPITNISINSEQLDGYTIFNYPISMENGWDYVKQQIGDTRDYIYDMDTRAQDTDLQAAEAYVNSEYAVALTELEV